MRKFKGETVKIKEEDSLFYEKHLLKYFKNIDDSKYFSRGSVRYIECKCPTCGFEKEVMSCNLFNNGFSCPKCKSYLSYPERLMMSYLEVKGIDYIHQYKIKGKNRLLDFYLPKHKIAIETHGEQHYKENITSNWSNSYIKTKESDKDKREYCLDNDIELIELDCSVSKFYYIRKSIDHSNLPNIEDEEKDAILQKTINIRDEKTLKIVQLIKEGKYAREIARIVEVDPTHVTNISKRYDLYDTYFKDGRGTKKVYCFETDKEYNSMSQVYRELNVSHRSIKSQISGNKDYCKGKNGEKYTFKFIH